MFHGVKAAAAMFSCGFVICASLVVDIFTVPNNAEKLA
jgi:hypothetical protein